MLDEKNTFIDFFESMVAALPNAIAISSPTGQCFAYNEINGRANQLARYLQEQGIQPEDPSHWSREKTINSESIVGILLLKEDPSWVITLLATLKIGAAFVLLEFDQYELSKPLAASKGDDASVLSINKQEIQDRLSATGCHTIVSDQTTASIIFSDDRTEAGRKIIEIDLISEMLGMYSAENIAYHPGLNTAAYFAFSSGTLGPPKAALFEHEALSLRTIDHQASLKLHPDDCIGQFSKLRFTDPVLMEVTLALSTGARLQLTPGDILASAQLDKAFNSWGVTMTIMTPTTMIYYNPSNFTSLKQIISTGERGDKDLFKRWIDNGKQVFNGYGPMECGIGVSLHDLQLDINDDDVDVSIGGEGARFQGLEFEFKSPIYEHEQQTSVNEKGVEEIETSLELYVSGRGISRGYIENGSYDEKRSKTVFHVMDGCVWYKTGDLFRSRGLDRQRKYYCMGRVDRQLQIGGVRVEPAAVEIRLISQLGHLGVRDVYVTGKKMGRSAELRLAAFIYPAADDRQFTLENIAELVPFSRSFMAEHPTWYYLIDRKVNLRACREKRKNIGEIGEENMVLIQPARGDLEARYEIENDIQQLWQEVLQYPKEVKIGLHQGFEQIGGSSMLKILLQSRIEEKYGLLVREGDFSGNLTIANLARHIFLTLFFLKHIQLANQPVHEINPLFILPPVDMCGDEIKRFSARLPKTIACYCLGLPGDGEDLLRYLNEEISGDICKNVQAQARYIILAIKQIKPFGPYHLAGWSYGGILAFEVARALEQNENVATAEIIDARAPRVAQGYSPREFYEQFKYIVSALGRLTHKTLSSFQFPPPISFVSIHDTIQHLEKSMVSQSQQKQIQVPAVLRLVLNNLFALKNYTPQKSRQEKLAFYHAEHSLEEDWRQVCQSSSHVELPKVSHQAALQSEILLNRISDRLKISICERTELYFQLPPRNKRFVGRIKLLDEMAGILQPRRSVIRKTVLVGTGGIGKTQLATEYAYKLSQHYPFCAYIQCGRPIEPQFRRLARSLFLKNHDSLEIGLLVDEIYKAFGSYAATLLIFDNVENYGSVERYLPAPSKLKSTVDILITTQDAHWVAGFEVIEVPLFEQEESITLFKEHLLLLDVELPSAKILSDELQNLPLAIEQAARYIDKYLPNKSRFEEYRQLLADSSKLAFKEGNLLGYDKTVLTAFKLGLDKVQAESNSAFDAIRACAYLDPDTIPIELINKAASPDDLRLLCQLSLLRCEHDIYSIHRLIQLVLRIEISDPCHAIVTKQALRNKVECFEMCMRKYSFFGADEAVRQDYHEMKQEAERGTVDRFDINQIFLILSRMLADCLKSLEKERLLDLFLQYISIAESVFNWCQNIFENYHLNDDVLLALSEFYYSFGSRIISDSENYIAAIIHYQHAIELLQRRKNHSVGDLGGKYMQLGESLSNAGRPREAIDILDRATTCFEKAEGDTRKVKLMAFRYRAVAYIGIDEVDRAIVQLNQYLDCFSRDNPSDYNPILWGSIHLGDAYRVSGALDEALRAYEEGLAFSYKDYQYKAQSNGETDGRDHEAHLWPLYRLALGYIEKGEYAKAQEYAEEANRVATLNLPDGDPNIGLTYQQLAEIHFRRGNLDEAIESALFSLKHYAYPHHDRSKPNHSCDLLNNLFLAKNESEIAEHFNKLKGARIQVIQGYVESQLQKYQKKDSHTLGPT